MQSKPAKPHFIDLARTVLDGDVTKGREDCQDGWHRLVAGLNLGTVLDVGAGLGHSKDRIPNCTTQDPSLDLNLRVDTFAPVQMIASASFDAVTAFDVIEHVVEDVDFLRELARIARRYVFVTTPNYDVSRAANGCHCREYTPTEFVALMESVGTVTDFWVGDGRGSDTVCMDRWGMMRTGSTSPHLAALIELEKS